MYCTVCSQYRSETRPRWPSDASRMKEPFGTWGTSKGRDWIWTASRKLRKEAPARIAAPRARGADGVVHRGDVLSKSKAARETGGLHDTRVSPTRQNVDELEDVVRGADRDLRVADGGGLGGARRRPWCRPAPRGQGRRFPRPRWRQPARAARRRRSPGCRRRRCPRRRSPTVHHRSCPGSRRRRHSPPGARRWPPHSCRRWPPGRPSRWWRRRGGPGRSRPSSGNSAPDPREGRRRRRSCSWARRRTASARSGAASSPISRWPSRSSSTRRTWRGADSAKSWGWRWRRGSR